ncbi:hypothetical protein HJC23_012588 [Cyclotella cryptica]|uniref:Uncharacterized protein n=1 Tax=Cyclotella cryptica TaxID=29204 RepID=A0ABD3NY98_9STRA|eukprot:CCRYP_019033-RA/>CCRYP_019033-RA protein AED:0.40 eAED:0.40 QI:177/1/1/1/0/0/2/329/346
MTDYGTTSSQTISVVTQNSRDGEKSYTMNDDVSLSKRNNGGFRTHRVNPFNLKECDAGFPHHGDIDSSTTRTELSTDCEDCSIHQRFSFASTNLYTANGGPSASYASSFDSNVANFPSVTGRRTMKIDVIGATESYEIVSELTGPQATCRSAYDNSLLDLDEDDALESPRDCPSWGESMFIKAYEANDTESRMNFYSMPTPRDGVAANAVRERLWSSGSMFIPSDGALDTDSRFGFYKQDTQNTRIASNRSMTVQTEEEQRNDSRNDFNIVNDTEEPPSCREKVEPVLSFTDDEEFDWLTQTTMKIEAKKKEQKNNESCGDYGAGVASNFRSFVSRCGSCFSPNRL